MKFSSTAVLALVSCVTLSACVTRGGQAPLRPASAVEDSIARVNQETYERLQRIAEEEARLEALRAQREAEIGQATEDLTAMVFFAYDSHEIDDATAQILRRKAAILRASPSVTIRIEGHTDERGSAEYNLALGQHRANAVREFLEAHGVQRSRISTLSYGRERLLVEGSTEESHAKNRRAEFVITAGEVIPAR